MQQSLFGSSHITYENRKAIIEQHRKEIAAGGVAIRDLQDSCPHNDVTRVHKSDTGNWCKSDDAYWTDCKCNVCGKVWTEDYHDGYGRR